MRGVTSKRRRQRAGARTSLRTLGRRRRARAGGIHAAGIWSLGSSRLVSVTEPASSRRSLASGEPPAEREVGAGAPRGACDPGMPSPCRRRQETPLPLPGVAGPVAAFRPLSRSGTVRTPSTASVQAARPQRGVAPSSPLPGLPPAPRGGLFGQRESQGPTALPPLALGVQPARLKGALDVTRTCLRPQFLFLCPSASRECVFSLLVLRRSPSFSFLTPEIPCLPVLTSRFAWHPPARGSCVFPRSPFHLGS